MLSADEILSCDDCKIVKVMVPEWAPNGKAEEECFIHVRTMSGADRDRFQSSCLIPGPTRARLNLANATAKLVSMAACDDQGKRLFTDAQVMDLGRKSCVALDRVADAARELNGMRPEDMQALQENFDDAQSGDSGFS